MLKTTEKWRFICYGAMGALIAVGLIAWTLAEKALPQWFWPVGQCAVTVLFLVGKALRVIELRQEKKAVTLEIISALVICGVFWGTGMELQ